LGRRTCVEPGKLGPHDAGGATRKAGPLRRLSTSRALRGAGAENGEATLNPSAERLFASPALAIEEAEEHTMTQVDLGLAARVHSDALEEGGVLAGVDELEGDFAPLLGLRARRDWVAGDELRGVLGQPEHAVGHLGDVPSRVPPGLAVPRARSSLAHDLLVVVERDVHDRLVPDDGEDVPPQVAKIRVRGALPLDVVGVLRGGLAPDPLHREVAECDRALL